MDQNTPSMSARGIAFLRAYHHKYDKHKIFDDEFAQVFVSPEDWTLFETHVLDHLATGFEPPQGLDNDAVIAQKMRYVITTSWALSRDRFIDEKQREALNEGFQQFVILGAGFDTFGLRCKDAEVRVVEIDHPATQRYKSEMLSKAAVLTPSNIHFYEADFEESDLTDILRASQYDPRVKTMFVWAGLNMYLAKNTVLKMLSTISEHSVSGSRIVFDYVCEDAFQEKTRSPRMSCLFQVLKSMGEPIITGFDPATLAETLQSSGMRLIENVTPAESFERYFEGHAHGYMHAEHVHFAVAEVTGYESYN